MAAYALILRLMVFIHIAVDFQAYHVPYLSRLPG